MKKYSRERLLIMSLVVMGLMSGCGSQKGTQQTSTTEPMQTETHDDYKATVQEQTIEGIESQTTTQSSIKMTMGKVDLTKIPLVNSSHILPEEYIVKLKWLPSGREQVAEEIYDSLMEMLTDGSDEGLSFVVSSGYRSTEYQQDLWDDTIRTWKRLGMSEEEAIKETAKTLAYPGASEHATGLAVDIVSLEYQDLDDKQHDTAESTWLRENCANYGFILRYPKGKESITGISYESWHFRYVGKEVAQCIMENGITLEEYLDYIHKEAY